MVSKQTQIACLRKLQKQPRASSQGTGMWTRCKYGPCHWLCCPSPVPLARLIHKCFLNMPQMYVSQGSRGSEKVDPSQNIISQGTRGSEKVLTKNNALSEKTFVCQDCS